MNPNPVNEFLPPAAGQPQRMDEMDEDEFDMARFSAIRKEQKDELERLEHHHHSKQHHIESQIRQEVDRLFGHFQQGMQNLYTGLTQTINATVEAQVKLRMDQERLREEHEANKREVERRYHNEASKIVMSTSHAARQAHQSVGHNKPPSFLKAPSSTVPTGGLLGVAVSLTPDAVSWEDGWCWLTGALVQVPNGDQHRSPASAPAALTPPGRRPVMAKPASMNPMPRDFAGYDTQHREYVAPYPTPQEPVPTQRRPVPSERRQTEPHHAEPRQVEPRHSEPRPVEKPLEPRPLEQRHMEHRPLEPRHADTRHVEPRPVDHHPVDPRYAQRRPAEQHPSEPIPSEPAHAEPRHAEHRHIEPRPVDTRPETHAARPGRTYYIYEEPAAMESRPPQPQDPKSSQDQAERLSEASTLAPSRQESKRKASDLMDPAVGDAYSKRPRTGERLTEEGQGQSPSKRSPRAQRSSQVPVETRMERTITFDEIYQKGKARYKHKIFEYKLGSGNWYIVRCDEHGVHFGHGNPVHGAAKHVHSPQHNNLEKRHDLAIEICGHRVLGCTAELAELNNREFERAVKEDKYTPFNSNLLTKEGRRRLTGGPSQDGQSNGSTTPKTAKKPKPTPPLEPVPKEAAPEECQFYEGYWGPTKKWYMLIVLPIRPDGSLREVGLREKLQETDLMGNIPKCYRVDRVSLQIKGWQPAYEDGGPKAAKREYPVMFFDGYTKHSVGWLGAHKLRPVDLDNPSENLEKRGLSIAREWYATHMMYRKSWDELKRLGRGEPPSATTSSSNADQLLSLRSAHTDEQSPIRDKSSGPGQHFGFGASSEEASDDEDPMTMDIGPIPETADSNYGPDDSDVDMNEDKEEGDAEDARAHQASGSRRRSSQNQPSRPSSRREPRVEPSKDEPTSSHPTGPAETSSGPLTPVTVNGGDQHENLSAAPSDQEHLRKSAQAKAVAAVMEAASRSRASSEVPNSTFEGQARPAPPSRPPFSDHNRSRSEDFARAHVEASQSAQVRSKTSEGRKPSDLHNLLNTDQNLPRPEPADEDHNDPYKRFEAIKAQMSGLRSASAPIHEGRSAASPFSPPPAASTPAATVAATAQPSPSLSHMMSPPSQPTTAVPPRSSSSTPVQDSGRTTPKIAVADNGPVDKWHAVRQGPVGAPPAQALTPRASFATMAPVDTSKENHEQGQGETVAQKLAVPTPQLGTPIPDKRESFDLSQFRDTSRGMRWSRDGPSTPYLRLKTDPMRGWAETAGGSPLKAGIEPLKVAKIEVDTAGADKQKVQLTLKDGHEQMVVFETNSANGRSQSATLQGRRFVSWVKKMNGEVELRNEYVSHVAA